MPLTDVAAQDKPAVYFDEDAEVWVYRASAISSCETALIAARMGLEGEPPPESMQNRFDDGHLHEPAILAKVEKETGWHPVSGLVATEEEDVDQFWIEDGQWAIEIPVMDDVVIRGHLDGIFENPNFYSLRVVEAKALSRASTQNWLQGGWDRFPYYRDQLTVYMTATGLPAIFAVKNKDSGEHHIDMIEEPPGDIEEILNRVRIIEGKGRAGLLPEECDRPSFPCPFWRLHPVEEVDEANLVASSEGLDQYLAEYAVARDDEKRAKAQKEEARDKILELLGDPGNVYEGVIWTAKQVGRTQRYLDKDRMKADGIDVDYYTDERHVYSISVERTK